MRIVILHFYSFRYYGFKNLTTNTVVVSGSSQKTCMSDAVYQKEEDATWLDRRLFERYRTKRETKHASEQSVLMRNKFISYSYPNKEVLWEKISSGDQQEPATTDLRLIQWPDSSSEEETKEKRKERESTEWRKELWTSCNKLCSTSL